MKTRYLITLALAVVLVSGCGAASAQSARDQIYQHQLNYMNIEQQALAAQEKMKQQKTENDAQIYGRAAAYGCRAQAEGVIGYEARRQTVYENCLLAHEPLKGNKAKAAR
jgi:hypothetical protein